MSERPRQHQTDAAAAREALSQWRRAARTEVRRTSSLPTSMFDTSDPMLEARLAESVEAMLTSLQGPRIEIGEPDATLEQRTEQVTPAELRALPRVIGREDGREPDLDVGLATEFLTLLVDTCATGSELARQHGATLLTRQLATALEIGADVAARARALHECLQDVLTRREAGTRDDARIVELCRHISALATLQTAPPEPAP